MKATDGNGDGEFGPKELVLIDLLADSLDTRSKDEKSVAAGFHEKHVYWLQRNRRRFNDMVYLRMREGLLMNLPRVYMQLIQLIDKKKDLKAIELLLKAAGEISVGGNQVNATIVRTNDSELRREIHSKTDAELYEALKSELADIKNLLEPGEWTAACGDEPPGTNRFKTHWD